MGVREAHACVNCVWQAIRLQFDTTQPNRPRQKHVQLIDLILSSLLLDTSHSPQQLSVMILSLGAAGTIVGVFPLGAINGSMFGLRV